MKNKLFALLSIASLVYASGPARFTEPAKFYSQDFEHKPGMKYVSIDMKIGILGDEIYMGRPRVYINDNIILCDCGKEATNINILHGEVNAKCDKCHIQIDPVNQMKHGQPKKNAKEINKK